jgi:hypothetical protein
MVATNGAILKLLIRAEAKIATFPVATLAATILIPDAEIGSELPVSDPISDHRGAIAVITNCLL